jgi:ring-1,2-phenylacetyl-CoA epoxidase subunit PaaD
MTTIPPRSEEEAQCWQLMNQLTDPEIPVLSLTDLGVIRNIEVNSPPAQKGIVTVTITATYTGCPAMDMMASMIKMELLSHGYKQVTVQHSISPAWTTEWMSEEGKKKLLEYGIAPPTKRFTIPADGIPCPQCGSDHTKLISEFGSTACKSLLQCKECGEPFDYFKCH